MTDANDPRRDRPDHEGRDPQHGDDTNDAPRSDETGETGERTEVPYGSEVPTQQPPAVDFGGDAPTQQQPAVDFGSDAPTHQGPIADAEDRPVVAETHVTSAPSDEEALPESVPAEYVPGDTASERAADADASTDADRRDTEVLSESDRDAASAGRPTEAVPMVAPTEPAQRAWSASTDGTRRPLHDDEALRAAEAARAGDPATGDRGDDTATAASATAATGASSSSHDGWVDDRSDAERDAADRAAADRQPSFGRDTPTAVAPTAAAAAGGAAAGSAAGRDTGSHAYPLIKDSGIDHVSVRRELLAQQKEEFGGIRFGAGLLGWFAATGFGLVMITIFGGVLAAWGGVASGSTAMDDLRGFTTDNADVLALTSGIVVLAIIFFGYLIGGYTASRIARFSGFKQGLATWLWGLVITIVLAIVVGVVGTQTGDSSSPNPFVPSMGDLQSSSVAGLIGLGLVVVLSFGGAVLGGLLGQRYHRKVDRFFSEEE
ncbi:CvpA family protein [Frigoribacterium sp. VKM Ac-2836]|uniref:CvpA family protein n=1 Tax=Frigoribacterium sp. VKM Ac-2836 TaxID=2739014 RepID=UPI00156711C7|nr:CvpA family protein [Frigoribacterium sp. VKM Ac-2836]NRD25189.1 CvpA family protein [Frigoribacterium sp. VKM Ac-2836]